MHLRKKFAVWSLLVATPILTILLLHHNSNWLTTILILVALIPAFIAALSDNILEIPPKLTQDIKSLQRNQIAANAARFFLVIISLFIFPFAFLAIGAGSISRLWANIRLKSISARHADFSQKPNPEIQKNIINIVKRVLPGSIYYCISGQITIWVISVFGSTTSLAQIGALTRLSMFITIFSVIITTLVVPRFARLKDNRTLLYNRFTQVLLGLLFLSLVFIYFTYLFPDPFLWLLGADYESLKVELILSVTAAFF